MKLNANFIKSVLTIYDELLNNGINLVYLGEFNQDITKMFTSMAEDDMDKQNEERAIKNKVYHVMVETLQNLNKHSDEIAKNKYTGRGLFMIGKNPESYYIITSNKVTEEKKIQLDKALIRVNSATPEELKEMYKHQLKHGKLSEKSGAGLGLIDMAKKTGQALDYHFIPHDGTDFFFILKVEINLKKLAKNVRSKDEVEAQTPQDLSED